MQPVSSSKLIRLCLYFVIQTHKFVLSLQTDTSQINPLPIKRNRVFAFNWTSHATNAILFLHWLSSKGMQWPHIRPCIWCSGIVSLNSSFSSVNNWRHFSCTLIIWALTAGASLSKSRSVVVARWTWGWRLRLTQIKCTTIHITALK